jgi:hypothetical protein
MATLTVDTTEYQEGDFSQDELDSLRVGEALHQEEQQLLAGKFRDAEDLEQAYIELQRKLGNPEDREPQQEVELQEEEPDEQQEPVDLNFLERLWLESQDDYSEETLEALQNMDPADLAQMYLEYRAQAEEASQVAPLSEDDVGQLKAVVGGDENYTAMMSWASEALSDQEISMYDTVMERGDPLACFFAVQALKSRFLDANGYDGQLLQGTAPSSSQDVFRSQAELVRAMSDPRYDNDPAYRMDIADKLERSNIQF